MTRDDEASSRSATEPALPRERAFVIQLASGADPAGGVFVGRAVHIESGEAVPFGDAEELFRFLASHPSSGTG